MTGKLSCKTIPSGATIYYDGKKQAYKTPITFTGCSPGVKTIKYELAGYESSTDRVEVFDDKTSYSTTTLKNIAPPPEEKGKIRCVTTPSGADVYFNGRKQINATPVTLTGVTPNKFHTIKYTKSDFLDASDQWLVKPGQTIVAEKILIPVMQPGYINAISDLPGVTVKMIIEGKTYTYPAPHKFGAPAGRNVVFFSKPDHKQVEHSVAVEPRQTVTLKGNPIPIIADTVLTLNTLPSKVSEGDKITLTGTLTSKDGKPVIGQIHFYDKDTTTADDELFENNKPLVAMSSSSTGKYSATWTAKKVDSGSLIKRGTSEAQIYAAFDGTSTHNKSKSTIRNITLKEIAKEGQLRITTRPPGADVYIDGKKQEIGTSAEEFSVIKKLPFGKYVVKTEIKGFDPMEEEVEIKDSPYETIVNHIYEGARNLCGVLGLETTELGCVRAILTLPVDLFTPLADAYIIKNHKSMYTGEPEEPTNMTYAFFMLGLIPFAGTVPKIVSKAGLKITAKGAQLAQLAKADPRIASIFMEENVIGKILSMTAAEVDKFIDLVVRKNYDGIRTMLKDTKAEALPTDKIDEIISNAKTIITDENALKRMEDILTIEKAVPDKFMFWSDWLTRILKADKTVVSHDEAAKILKDAMEDPSLFRKIADELDLSGITSRLEAIDSNESLGVYSLIRWISKIDTRLPIEQQNKLVAEMAETALATLENTPKFTKELPKALDEINEIADSVYPFTSAIRAAGLDAPFNIIDELTVFLRTIKTTPFLSRPKATAAFIKKLMIASREFLRAHPDLAMKLFVTTATGVLVMSLWFNSDNTPFHYNHWLKARGLGPGTRSYKVGEHLEGLKTQSFIVKNNCKENNLSAFADSLVLYKKQLKDLEDYINKDDNRETLEKENSLVLALNGLATYTDLLKTDDIKKCIPAEITIPESGIIEDVFVSKVIDGDTIECRKDDETFKVRIVGINTPDKGPAGYSAACSEIKDAETNTVWCSKDTYTKSIKQLWDLTDDKVISLKVDPSFAQDTYGRYVALLMNKAGDEINFEMIKSGYACYYHRKDFKETGLINHGEYTTARNTARDAKLGIWAPFELDVDIGYADFTTIPTGAQIYINNEYFTTTKKSNASFETGTHSVRFVKEGFHPCEQEFEIKKNEKTPVTCTLKKITEEEKKLEGYALFRAFRKSSSGELVSISADVWDETSFLFRTSQSTSRALPPGDYNITFKRYNYEDKSTTFTIATNKTITVDETLTELPTDETEDPAEPDEPFGLVDFMSTPSVAKIFVNESYIGTTKKSGFKLAKGSYSVMFEKEGYETCTKQLVVIVDERIPVDCILTESLLPPTEGEYPEVPYFPTTPSRRTSPPSTYAIAPMPAPPTKQEPKAEPWEEFETPMKVLFLNIGKEIPKQSTITTAGQKFMDKHCDLEFGWESNDHDMVELGVDDNDCATLDDAEELTEVIEQDKVPEGTKIIYLLWDADEPKCVSYTGFTGDTEDLLFDAMLCSSPTSKSEPEFTATTGKLKNDNLKIEYEGSLTIIIQICEALHELYEKTKSNDAPELPEFDEEFCEKNITEDRPNAKCVVEWLSKFNSALPDEVKK